MTKDQREAVEGFLTYLLECGKSHGNPQWLKVHLKDMYEGIYLLKKFYDEHEENKDYD